MTRLVPLFLLLALQDEAKIRTERLAEHICMMTGQGGNLGVCVGEDGVFLIDDQFAPLTKAIQAAIGEISEHPVRFLVNTHWHGDHTGGNENFGKAGAVIVAHENVRKRMSAEQFIEAFGRKVPASPEDALPVVTFADRVTFHLNGEEIEVFHAENAHTDGDAIIRFRTSDVIHTGDTFFNGMYPFIDVSSGGSIDGMIEAVENVLRISGEETKFIPGHGPRGSKKDLEEYRDMLQDVRNAVEELVREGKSASGVKAAKPTAKHDARWGKGFLTPDAFVDIVYSSLKKRD